MPFPPLAQRLRRRGFTMLELLLVIAILGVASAIVLPRMSASTAGSRLRVGARAVTQAVRYARTMALLHQMDIDIRFDLEGGKIRVEAAPLTGERADGGAAGRIEIASHEDDDGTDRARDGGRGGESAAYPDGSGDDPYGPAATSGARLSATALAEDVRAELDAPGCTFAFLGYTDSPGAAASPSPAGDGKEARVRFRSNGTCRPFQLRVNITDDDAILVAVDILGSPATTREGGR